MKAIVKAKWLEALRSGKYAQVKKTLRRGDGFCCLGVLCDISGKADWEKVKRSKDKKSYLGQKGELPEEVRKWAGLDDSNPYIYGVSSSLTNLNDKGKTFEEIADIIEKKL